MNDRRHDKNKQISMCDPEDLMITMSELNESIAYLSKMMVQLQKSINQSGLVKKDKKQESTEEKIVSDKTFH